MILVDDLALISNTPAKSESVLHRCKKRGIDLNEIKQSQASEISRPLHIHW